LGGFGKGEKEGGEKRYELVSLHACEAREGRRKLCRKKRKKAGSKHVKCPKI